MEAISLQEILVWTGGRADRPGGAEALRVSTDSREVAPGDCFVALPGERFDGHDFIGEAVERGAAIVVYEAKRYTPPASQARTRFVAVTDTKLAYQEIARGYRRRFAIPVVGITGSNGKTTTKEMTASVLSGLGEIVATEKNFNNEIGLPKTLFRIERRHAAAVVEMGMRGLGEIARLAEIASPTVGVVTNVGPVHVGRLGSVERVADAKGELIRALPATGTAVLNADDPRVAAMARAARARVVTYGIEGDAEVRAGKIESLGLSGSTFTLVWPGARAVVRLAIPGRHHVYNALAAAAVGMALGLGIDAVAAGLAAVKAAPMRTEVVELAEGVVLIDDAYNSSPLSAGAALDLLAQVRGKRKIAVLGDMLELGEFAAELHRGLGRKAVEAGVAVVVAVGQFASELARGVGEAGDGRTEVLVCKDAAEAAEAARDVVRPGDVVLVKGSRGVALEKVSGAVKEMYGAGPG